MPVEAVALNGEIQIGPLFWQCFEVFSSVLDEQRRFAYLLQVHISLNHNNIRNLYGPARVYQRNLKITALISYHQVAHRKLLGRCDGCQQLTVHNLIHLSVDAWPYQPESWTNRGQISHRRIFKRNARSTFQAAT